MSRWEAINEKYRAITLREKILVLAAGLAVIGLLGNMLLLEPVLKSKAQLEQQVQDLQAEQRRNDAQIEALAVQLRTDQTKLVEAEIAQLETDLTGINARLATETIDLIPPQLMANALRDVLSQRGKLKLLSMNNLAPEPVMKAPEGKAAQLFKHTMVLKLEGSYFQIKAFIESVEQLPWKFYWQDFDYSVRAYPTAELEITLFTLSTSPVLMGAGI